MKIGTEKLARLNNRSFSRIVSTAFVHGRRFIYFSGNQLISFIEGVIENLLSLNCQSPRYQNLFCQTYSSLHVGFYCIYIVICEYVTLNK